MIEVKSTNEEKVHIHLNPQRLKKGTTDQYEDAPIDGDITYEVTEGDATVDDTDNRNPFFVSGDQAMESKIEASADADLGAGIETIVQQFSYVVSFPKATGFGVTMDAPEPK